IIDARSTFKNAVKKLIKVLNEKHQYLNYWSERENEQPKLSEIYKEFQLDRNVAGYTQFLRNFVAFVMDRLSEKARVVALLRSEGKTFSEIAEATGRPLKEIQSDWHYIQEQFTEFLRYP